MHTSVLHDCFVHSDDSCSWHFQWLEMESGLALPHQGIDVLDVVLVGFFPSARPWGISFLRHPRRCTQTWTLDGLSGRGQSHSPCHHCLVCHLLSWAPPQGVFATHFAPGTRSPGLDSVNPEQPGSLLCGTHSIEPTFRVTVRSNGFIHAQLLKQGLVRDRRSVKMTCFFGCTRSTQKFPGQESNPRPSSDNARSLTC